MITKFESWASRGVTFDIYGLSTDEKPTDVPNASSFYEMDTKTLHMFDAENGIWLQQ